MTQPTNHKPSRSDYLALLREEMAPAFPPPQVHPLRYLTIIVDKEDRYHYVLHATLDEAFAYFEDLVFMLPGGTSWWPYAFYDLDTGKQIIVSEGNPAGSGKCGPDLQDLAAKHAA